MYVIITSTGFLTIKDKLTLESTDTIIWEGTEDECYDIIHGKRKKQIYK